MKNSAGNALKPKKLTDALMVAAWDLRANLTKVQARNVRMVVGALDNSYVPRYIGTNEGS